MKKTQSLKSLLGFTHEELALMLQIGHSHLAKYEKGIRNLPRASMSLLAEMLKYMCGPEAPLKTTGMAEQQVQKQNAVQAMLKENEYQLLLTSRKIASLEKKCATNLKALQLAELLTLRTESTETDKLASLRTITDKATKALKVQGLDKLFKLKVKLELLQKEKELLVAEN